MARARGRILLAGAAAACFFACACGTAPRPSARQGPAQSLVAPATSVGPATPSPAETAGLSPLGGVSVEVHLLDARFIPADAPISADGQILWAAGGQSPSEIWRYTPGGAAPERIFASPRAESNITSVVAGSGRYAFVEQSGPAFGDGGWRVWMLAAPGAQPVQLDAGMAKKAGAAPTIAMDAMREVWAGFDERQAPFVSRLAMTSTADPRHVTTLLERPVDKSLMWYPALDGDELWYGTIDPGSDPTADGPEYHLETLDLGNPGASPVRFEGTGHDFNPAVNDAYVIWKANRRGDAALNWGTLKMLDRASGAIWAIPADHANRPSIGTRYVTFAGLSPTSLPVYDPATRTLFDLAPGGLFGGRGQYGGQSLSGRLLTFFVGQPDAGAPPRIGWAILPE